MYQAKILLVVAFSTLSIGRECQKNIPNIDWITVGLDLSRVDLHPPAGRTPEGQMARVIQYTCNKGKKWTLDGVEYDLPDQIDRIDGNSQGSFSSFVVSSHTLNKFKESMGIEVGMGLNFPLFSFSVSSTYKESQERLSDKKKIVSTTNAAQTAWVARHLAPLVLPNHVTPSFKADVDNLPATYAEDPAKYLNFINTYGTHFHTSGTFGGTFYFELISDESLSSFEDSHTIGVNAEISAQNFLAAKGAVENTNQTASESFRNRTKMMSRYFGGEANLFEEEGFKAWWPTVITNPTMRGCELNPISALAKDKSKRPELDKAVDVHLLMNFLKYDAKYVLGVYLRRDYDYEKVSKYLDDIEALLPPGSIPDQSALQAKANEIHKYAFTPDWMSDSVQICIKFIP